MAEKARQRRAKHKGGNIPSRLHKVNVEFFESDDDEKDDSKTKGEKKTVEMFDLMHKSGSTLKCYSLEEEE